MCDKLRIIKKRLKLTLYRQKSYVDPKRKDVGFQMFLKLLPWKGVVWFEKRGKLSLRYIGLYKVT